MAKKPVKRAAARKTARPAPKPKAAARPAPKPTPKAAASPTARPASKLTSKAAASPTARPAPKPTSIAAARPTVSPAAPKPAPASRPAPAAARPGGSPAPRKAPVARGTEPAATRIVVAPRPVLPERPAVEPTLLQRAERLRDDVQRSKLTHPDPWSYTAKARAWGERAQALVDAIADAGDSPAQQRTLDTLAAEIEGDADFRQARALF